MKSIRLKVSLASVNEHGAAISWEVGAVVEWDAADADRLIKRGYAEPVKGEAPSRK